MRFHEKRPPDLAAGFFFLEGKPDERQRLIESETERTRGRGSSGRLRLHAPPNGSEWVAAGLPICGRVQRRNSNSRKRSGRLRQPRASRRRIRKRKATAVMNGSGLTF